MPPGRKPKPLAERIADGYLVDEETGCWVWQRCITHGYGRITTGSRTDGTRYTNYAHRVVYEVLRGPIPDGLDLDHLCRNPACVNPDHLEPVTTQVNLLRGVGPAAKQAAQTHCKEGHEFTPENTYMNQNKRYCRTCKRNYGREWDRRRRERARA